MAFSKVRNGMGFTLIELMIVIAIIGILAGVAVPRYMNFLQRSKEGATKGNLGALRSALNIYYADTEFYYPRLISYDPAWPLLLYTNDGFGWVIHPDFQAYLDEIPPCTIGPEPPPPFQHTRSDIYHQGGAAISSPPNPGPNDVGWLYYRSSDTVTGVTNTGRIYVNVKGSDYKGIYYTSW